MSGNQEGDLGEGGDVNNPGTLAGACKVPGASTGLPGMGLGLFNTCQGVQQSPMIFRTPSPLAGSLIQGQGGGLRSPYPGQRQEGFKTPRSSIPPPLATSTPQHPPVGVRIQTPLRSGGSGGLPARSPSVCVVAEGSQSSLRSVGRRLPQTPPSNFNIRAPDLSSDSSSNSDDSIDDDIFPPGCGNVGGLRDIARSRWRQSGNNDGEGADPGNSGLSETILGENGSVHSAAIRRRRQLLEGRAEENSKEVVLCTVWAGGRLAASYYDLETGQLFMLPDIADSSPDFPVMRSVFNQVNPTYVIVNKRSDDQFLKVVYELTGYRLVGGNDDDEVAENLPDNTQNNNSVHVYHLPSKEFMPDGCKARVQALQLPFEPANLGQAEHIMFVTSLIPFANEVMVRTMGCLLKFLDKYAIELFQLELVRGHIPVADVILFKMDDVVIVDDSAWRSLQIFSTDFHPSSFKQGSASGSKEGLSVYSILNRCVTTQGAKTLRLMLLRPSRNPNVIRRRFDVIEFCMHTVNLEFVLSMTDCLKPIKSIPKLLYRLSLLHATVTEWKQLYQTLYHSLLLAELSHSRDNLPELISDIGNVDFINVLRSLTQEMMRLIDFDQSETSNRLVCKEGIDPELDKKKRQYACLPEIMSIVASEDMDDLPSYIKQCCAVYIPEIGYLLAVSLWREDLTDEDLRMDTVEFRFKTQDLAYYKTPRMRELDVVLGDCSVAILEKETIMMVRLTELILLNSSILHKINELVSELDSLIAMSAIAKSNNFVRPNLVASEERLKILNGRHPISEMLCEFLPNSTVFKGQEKVVILTGPNASGKSVYLKQVGVIVIMALSGSFVPAAFAQIPLYDKLCTRVHAAESVSSGFSSFMVDINQMSLAIRSASRNTLVIVDEFGKGTLEADGLSILTASIQHFIDRGPDCPTIFLSTHFSSMNKYLRDAPLIKYQSMRYLDEDGTITYLYELKDGCCETSFAAKLAKDQGIPAHVVERAIEMENVTRGRSAVEIQPVKTQAQIEKEEAMIGIADEFLKINFQDRNPFAFLQCVKRKMKFVLSREKAASQKQD